MSAVNLHPPIWRSFRRGAIADPRSRRAGHDFGAGSWTRRSGGWP